MEVTKYVITNNLSVLYNTREEAEAHGGSNGGNGYHSK